MRFLMLLRGDGTPSAPPSPEDTVRLARYNVDLTKAGVLRDLGGLHPSPEGQRVRLAGGGPRTAEGPSPDEGQPIQGFWLLEVASREEALEWAGRFPRLSGLGEAELELRQLFDFDDYTPGHAPRG